MFYSTWHISSFLLLNALRLLGRCTIVAAALRLSAAGDRNLACGDGEGTSGVGRTPLGTSLLLEGAQWVGHTRVGDLH